MRTACATCCACRRRAAGLPALAIAWGPVDHVGYVAEILKVHPLLLHILLGDQPSRLCFQSSTTTSMQPTMWTCEFQQ